MHHLVRLATVTQDGILAGVGSKIVHQASASTQTPKWRGAKLIRRVCRTGLDDAISRTYVLQQGIAKCVDDLVAQRVRHRNAPPFITVPGGAVTPVSTCQNLQPIA